MLLLQKVVGCMALSMLISCFCYAQGWYLVKPDYKNITVPPKRIAAIPGVRTIDNQQAMTFDEVSQRYFFFANETPSTGAAELYSLDAVTGEVLGHPVCPANVSGKIYGLKYDQETNRLLGIRVGGYGRNVRTNNYFCWINPATGEAHAIASLPEGRGTTGKAFFDKKMHRYIYEGLGIDGDTIFSIDASTGQDITITTIPNTHTYGLGGVWNCYFNNVNQQLIGPGSVTQFTNGLFRLDPYSAKRALLAEWSALGIGGPVWNGSSIGINESEGEFFFASDVQQASGDPCAYRNTFYTADAYTGQRLSQSYFPYTTNPDSTQKSEILFGFAVDNKHNNLYALNWHLHPDPPIPEVTIAASAETICPGDTLHFTALAGANAPNPTYQWRVNGSPIGADSSVFSSHTLRDNDTVDCMLVTSTPCSINQAGVSQQVVVRYKPLQPSSVSISASDTAICSGQPIKFTAKPVNGGPSPSYQWLVDGKVSHIGSGTFSNNALTDGAMISCILQSSHCSLPAPSEDTIRIHVYPTPSLYMAADTVINPGASVELIPSASGPIQNMQWTSATGFNALGCLSVRVTPEKTTTFQLTVSSDKGCSASGQQTVTVYYPLRMPNAFSPNGDGKNDFFEIPTSTPQKISRFAVYSRWGQPVFATNSCTSGWDGRINGQAAPTGTYIWEVEYEDLLTRKMTRASGTLMLVR